MFSYAFKKFVQHLVPIIAIVALVGIVGWNYKSGVYANHAAATFTCAPNTNITPGTTNIFVAITGGGAFQAVTGATVGGIAAVLGTGNPTEQNLVPGATTPVGAQIVAITDADGTTAVCTVTVVAAVATTASGAVASEQQKNPFGLTTAPLGGFEYESYLEYVTNVLTYDQYATVFEPTTLKPEDEKVREITDEFETVTTIPITQACVLPGLGIDYVDVFKFEEVTKKIYSAELGFTWLGGGRTAEPKPNYEDADGMDDGVSLINQGYETGVSVNEVRIDNRLSPVTALTRVTYILDPFDGEGGGEELLATRATPAGAYDVWNGVGLVPLTLPEDVEPGTERCGYANVLSLGCGGEDESYKFCVKKAEEEEDDFCDIVPVGATNNFPNDYYSGDLSLIFRSEGISYPTIQAQTLAGGDNMMIGIANDGRLFAEIVLVDKDFRGRQGTPTLVFSKAPIPLNTPFVAASAFKGGSLTLSVYSNKKIVSETTKVSERFPLENSSGIYEYTPFSQYSVGGNPRGLALAAAGNWGVYGRALTSKEIRSFRFCPAKDFEDLFDIRFEEYQSPFSYVLRQPQIFDVFFDLTSEPRSEGQGEEVTVEFEKLQEEAPDIEVVFEALGEEEEIFDVTIELDSDFRPEIAVTFEPVSLENLFRIQDPIEISVEPISEQTPTEPVTVRSIRQIGENVQIKELPVTILGIREITPVVTPTASVPRAISGSDSKEKPVISGVAPAVAAVGDKLTILGENFAVNGLNVVRVGDIAMLLKSFDGKTLSFVLPADGPSGCGLAGACTADILALGSGSVIIRVSTLNGTSNDYLISIIK